MAGRIDCDACWNKEHFDKAPITDDACYCVVCDGGPYSGSYMHTCRGRFECERCFVKPIEEPHCQAA
jgi:hypothetical protein